MKTAIPTIWVALMFLLSACGSTGDKTIPADCFPTDTTAVFSTCLWGDGTVNLGTTGYNHVSIRVNKAISEAGIDSEPIKVASIAPESVSVTLNGRSVCTFGKVKVLESQKCALGRLKAGDIVDLVLKFRAVAPGMDEWNFPFRHDNNVTGNDLGLTVK